MTELIGLLFALLAIWFVALPVITFVVVMRLRREVAELRGRMAAIEAPGTGTGARPAAPAAAPTPAVERAPVTATPPAVAFEPRPADSPTSPGWTVAAGSAIPPLPTHIESSASAESLESRLGGRGLLYTGVLVLLFGVSFFLKYAFDNAWIGETGRVLFGAAAGAGLIAGGLRLARRGFDAFGHALAGTGFAILYLAIYAALNFYGLIGRGAAFALMVAVTLAAAGAAHGRRAQSLAVIAVGGGFLTPALVGGSQNAQLTLFTYDALLVAGTVLLAFRHRWPGLNALSYVGTLVTVVVWADRFYTDDQWLRTLLFLTLFAVLFLIVLRETARQTGPVARAVVALLATAPVFYHVTAVYLTAAHSPAIHIYLIAFTAAGLWVTVDPARPALRLAVLVAAYVPMLGAETLPTARAWLFTNLVTAAAVAALHVMALIDRVLRQDGRLGGASLLAIHVGGLGFFAVLHGLVEPHAPGLGGGLAALVATGAALLWRWLRSRDEVAASHAAALAAALVAIGLAVQFDGPVVAIGWAVEGMAVAWVGRRAAQSWFQAGGLVLWALAALRLFDELLYGAAALPAVLNARSAAVAVAVSTGYLLVQRFAHARDIRAALHVAAAVLTLAWMTVEIRSYWATQGSDPQAALSEQMLLSLAWGVYGALLVGLGMRQAYAPLRYIGMSVLAIASLKVFFYDLWELGGIYRVVGFIGFGVLLVLVSYLYQRQRGATPMDNGQPAGEQTS